MLVQQLKTSCLFVCFMIATICCINYKIPPHPNNFIENVKNNNIASKEKFKDQMYKLIYVSIVNGFEQFYVPEVDYWVGNRNEQYFSNPNISLIETESLIEIGVEMKNNGYYFGCGRKGEVSNMDKSIVYGCVIRVIEYNDQYIRCPHVDIFHGIRMDVDDDNRVAYERYPQKPIQYCPYHSNCGR